MSVCITYMPYNVWILNVQVYKVLFTHNNLLVVFFSSTLCLNLEQDMESKNQDHQQEVERLQQDSQLDKEKLRHESQLKKLKDVGGMLFGLYHADAAAW